MKGGGGQIKSNIIHRERKEGRKEVRDVEDLFNHDEVANEFDENGVDKNHLISE